MHFLLLELPRRYQELEVDLHVAAGPGRPHLVLKLAKVEWHATHTNRLVEARDVDTTKSLFVEAAHGRGVIAVDGDRADPHWACRQHDMLAALRRDMEPFSGRSLLPARHDGG